MKVYFIFLLVILIFFTLKICITYMSLKNFHECTIDNYMRQINYSYEEMNYILNIYFFNVQHVISKKNIFDFSSI